ncbi:MAG TPA: hypothetical protein VNZ64_03195 [Candidatus Acidoferrum sp.]|nr:hypothetical protein [Candidatus Acidoferrum sp.]
MQWQGYVRGRRRYYKQIHVLTYPGREYLYEGCQVHFHDIDLKNAGYWYGRLSPADSERMARAKADEIGLKDYDIFDTSLLCTQYHKRLFWRQEFRLLAEPPLVQTPYDVVFHFRAVRKVGPDPLKNYPPPLADELARRCIDEGLSVACVGHPDYSYCPANCADLRFADLRQTVAAISSARVGVGEASGGMHLVNACGKPSIIWGDGQWRIDPALNWNPFRVPIYVVTNAAWQPTPTEVCHATVKALEDLRARTDTFTRPAYTLPAQPIGYF